MVVIVDNSDLGLEKNNLVLKESGKRCKHLKGNEPGKFECAIHNKKWYKRTPCFSHGQIEQSNSNCRMGEYILNGNQSLIKELEYGKLF